MALTYTYHDAHLARLITETREADALADVGLIGTFPADWLERLTVLRAYIQTCMESMKSGDDIYSAKLTEYRREWDTTLAHATAAAEAAGSTVSDVVGWPALNADGSR